MSIKKINEFPEGSGNLSADDVFLFMDNPTGSGTTKKISLANLIDGIGIVAASGTDAFSLTTVDLHNGGTQNAQVLSFNNPDYQSVITGPVPASGNNAQRIIIQGRRGEGSGEGGDVYLWGGDSAINGGDIKIYAGDADDPSSGYGGYVNIDGGNGYNQGGNVTISAGNSSEYAGNVTITAGSAPLSSGVVYIRAGGGSNQWEFNNNGAIVFPNYTTVSVGTFDNSTGGNNGISLNCYVGYELNWQGGHLKSTQDNGVSAANIWCDSGLEFPGSGSDYMEINASGLIFSDGTTQTSAPGLVKIFDHGAVSGSTAIDYGSDKSIQTLTLNGTATTFTKGSGWPTSSDISCDVVLRITVSSSTAITWSIVTDWFNQAPAGALSTGTHLFLLRAIGSSIVEGHYINKKSN